MHSEFSIFFFNVCLFLFNEKMKFKKRDRGRTSTELQLNSLAGNKLLNESGLKHTFKPTSQRIPPFPQPDPRVCLQWCKRSQGGPEKSGAYLPYLPGGGAGRVEERCGMVSRVVGSLFECGTTPASYSVSDLLFFFFCFVGKKRVWFSFFSVLFPLK